MRTNAAVTSLLLVVVLLPACSRHSATTGAAPAVAPASAPAAQPSAVEPPAVEPPALEPLPAPAPAPVPEPTPATAPVATAQPVLPPVIDPSLEQAASLAANGQPEQAQRVYLALLNSANVSRATIAAAAQGLYRLAAYADAVEAFRNLGTFSRGEEDLRYYNAVSLFETGHYDDAKKELACALPYIQITSDVARYRDKIQQMGSPQALKK
ncbi:MAG: tetratricopeptide repeat protein [Thermoanaerobaculia bacterium]